MKESLQTSLSDPRVAISKLPSASYGVCKSQVNTGAAASESDRETNGGACEVAKALARAASALGWSNAERGVLGGVIPEGTRVLVKPNFVLHQNEGGYGMEPMVTHGSLIRATVEAALEAGASQVLVGDAPVQKCDFEELLRVTGVDEWATNLAASEPRFAGVRDFRRTTCVVEDGVRLADENKIPLDRFVLFDLGEDSLLEPVSGGDNAFRVTCYDPRLMAKTHAPGRHQYLVARDVMEADVVINLPKLKTHKKAGVTCALKNLIGINGNKEYLPHHRVGGSRSEGDCYPGADLTKRALEYTLDRQNMAESAATGRLWNRVAENLQRVLRLTGDELGVEGSWSGNDTIWRTCLDLNRVLLYGRDDGALSNAPQRRVLHIADAVIAGQGDGPLAPLPLPLGLIFAGSNAVAVDMVGAMLLGYDPRRIPVVREAFGDFLWRLAAFAPDDVALVGDAGQDAAGDLLVLPDTRVIHPVGWRDAARQV